jgi:hypothetical protein
VSALNEARRARPFPDFLLPQKTKTLRNSG